MLRRVEACGGFTTKVTSVCQLFALPFSLSTGRTAGLPSTEATVGWAWVSGPKRAAKRTWASSSWTFASRKTKALCLFRASRIWAIVASLRSLLRSRPRISAPMRALSFRNSRRVWVVIDMVDSFGLRGLVRLGSDGGPPPGEVPFDGDQQVVDQQAEQRDGEDSGIHVRDQETGLGVDDQVPEARLGTDHLRRNEHQDRGRSGHPDSGENGRHRRGKDDLQEQPEVGESQRAGGPDEQRVYGPDAGDGVQQHGEERGVSHDADLGGLADPQQEGEDREQRQRRRVPEDLQQWVEEPVKGPVPGDQQAKGH